MEVRGGIRMDKYDKHIVICLELNQIYRDKNHDYGDSFGETFEKLGIISAVTKITDKVNRLVTQYDYYVS